VYRVVLVDVKIRERTVAPCEELARLRIPNADRAVIEPSKLHDYLLSRGHPVGRFKASFFLALGYSAETWRQLASMNAITLTSHLGVIDKIGSRFLLCLAIVFQCSRGKLAPQASQRSFVAFPPRSSTPS
jgi:hypothetical protein